MANLYHFIHRRNHGNERAHGKQQPEHRRPTPFIGYRAKPVRAYRTADITTAVDNARDKSRIDFTLHLQREYGSYRTVGRACKEISKRERNQGYRRHA